MAIERFDLAPADDGREQYAMIERRPTRDQIKDIERKVRQSGGLETVAQEALVSVLVESWVLYDKDGEVVPPLSHGKKGWGRVPGDTVLPLVMECSTIIDLVNRPRALAQLRSTLLQLAGPLDDEQAERVAAIADELDGIFGVTPPNA